MPYVVDFRGRGSFGLGFDYEGDVPPGEMRLGDFAIESSGAEFSGAFGGCNQKFSGELELLTVQSLFFSAILEAVTVTSDMQSAARGELPLGSSELSICRLSISDPLQGADASFTTSGMRVTIDANKNDDDELIDVGVVYAVDSLTIGTDIAVEQAQLGIRLEHLDAVAAAELYRFAELVDGAGDSDELEAQMMPILGRLLAGGPVLLLDPMIISMPEGELTGKLTLTLDPAAIPPGAVLDEMMLTQAMVSAGITLDLTASKPLVQLLAEQYLLSQMQSEIDFGIQGQIPVPPEQLAAQAEMQANLVLLLISSQGMIRDQGDTWATTFSLENGVATANGQPIPLGF
jgi:uncharacterized protein YdgA (DUF945 family)